MSDTPKFTASPERTSLLREMRKLKPGESVTFSAISTACGFNVEARRHLCYAVRTAIQANGDGTIESIPGGFRRLTDTEVVNTKAPQYERRIRSAAKRGARALTGVEYSSLTEADRREHNTHLAALGAMQLVASRPSLKRVRDAVEEAKRSFDARETLKLFEIVK